MELDRDRLEAILKSGHSYYGGQDIPTRSDSRWDIHNLTDFIPRFLKPTDRVLDLGCGRGHILLAMCSSFQHGLGIDSDPDHIQMAVDARQAQGVQNVDFRLLDFPVQADRLPPESFDMLISIRGALYDTDESMQAAHRLLRPDGLLFCEEIGELHHQEAGALFFDDFAANVQHSTLKRYRDLLESNGFEVRLAADILGKIIFPDIYAWLAYVCNIWSWLGMKLPEPDDPRLALFAEQNTIPSGEVSMTWHTPWIGCVRQ